MLVNTNRRSGARGESGQALILGVLGMTLVLVIGVIVVDFGLWFSGRSSVVNALDQASTAASLKLPTDGAGAEAVALQYAQDNDFDIAAGDVDVTFRCIVGDRNNDGQPDRGDILTVCPQLYGDAVPFICIGALCYHVCDYSAPNAKCNTIVVQGQKTVEFGFAPIFGIAGAEAPGFVSAACRGACGGPPTIPLDLVIILDRSTSMSSDELDEARNGANAILQLFDPAVQHVALGMLPQSLPSNDCASVSNNNDPGNWIVTPLLDDYQNPDGTLNSSSEIVADINCIELAVTSGPHTNLGDPVKAAKDFLLATGRPDVKKGIILMTDGAANQPSRQTPFLSCTANDPVTSGSGDNDGYEITPWNACDDGGGEAVDANSGTGPSTSCPSTGSTDNDRHLFYDYDIPVPASSSVSGVEVRLDASATPAAGTRNLCVQLSWDGGASWSSSLSTTSLTASEQTYLLGGASSTWGHAWTPTQLSDANFRVRVTDVGDAGGSGTLQTVANGTYIAWTGDETDVDETSSFSCGSTDAIIEGTTGDRESFTIDLSSVPNGAVITSVDINVRDRGDSVASGTYQTFARLDGTDTDSGVNLSATGTSGCNAKSQNIDVVDTAKSGGTTLEIGVVKTATNTNIVRVGTMSAIVNYTVDRAFSLDWVAVRVHYIPGSGPCNYAYQEATAAKAVDPPIEIFSIGFGLDDAGGGNPAHCSDETSSSPYRNTGSSSNPSANSLATKLLADMATDSLDDGGDGPGGLSGGCDNATEIASENTDGDHFLCEAKSGDLEPVFREAGEQLAGGSRLIKLPPSMLP